MKQDNQKLVSIIYEAAALKRLRRTGWQILGDNNEGVGEHSFMTAVIAYFLAQQVDANIQTVLLMSIFHDFHEVRTGEMDKVNTMYSVRHEQKANDDIFKNIDTTLLDALHEYEKKESVESRIVYEANIIALLVELKQLVEKGNVNAQEWLDGNALRVRLPQAKALAQKVMQTNSQVFWKDIRDTLHENFAK